MPKPYLMVDWHLSQRCNLKCSHCYASSPEFKEEERSGEILDRILELTKNFEVRVTLTGGEPLLREDVFRIAGSLSDHGIGITLTTNGVLVIDRIREIVGSGLSIVQVSIDGLEASHDYLRGTGSFLKAREAIELLTREGIPVSIMTTVSRYNLGDVPGIIDFALEKNISLLCFQRLIPIGRGTACRDLALKPGELKNLLEFLFQKKEELEGSIFLDTTDPLGSLLEKKTGIGCPIGATILTLTPSGDVLACCKLPVKIGNIVETGFENIWNSDALNVFRRREEIKGKCRECPRKSTCGGCRAAAYALNKDYLGEDPQCWL